MIDNLFIVESPLQALVAVELSLQFEKKNNGIIYRLSGEGRELNDQQILKVIEYGNWCFQEQAQLSNIGGLKGSLNIRGYILGLKKRFKYKVKKIFFGEFRSQWMHFARFAIAPEQSILIDDGAATLTAKHKYIDREVYYPEELWSNTSFFKKCVKGAIYFCFVDKVEAQRKIKFASAFLKDESIFKVDFSEIRRSMASVHDSIPCSQPKAYFFGSKYSEAGILSRDYELNFIANVYDYYQDKNLGVVYCAHRDESEEKLDKIRHDIGLEVVRPNLPAELFLLECDRNVSEIGAAYSSVINNLNLMFPDKPITSFRLDLKYVNLEKRSEVDHVYICFEKNNIHIKSFPDYA